MPSPDSLPRQPAEPTLRVSVVIPVYNRTDLLSRSLAGLCAQTYPGDLFDVIVADDGSEEDVTPRWRRLR